MALKWVPLLTYLRTAYPEGEAPDPRTIRRAIDRQELAGKRSGTGKRAHYYVLVDADTGVEAKQPPTQEEIRPVNHIAEQILKKVAGF